jgi:L-asparaginase/Glu-tRNA(Gln) amidotransferase subunit D
VEVDKLVTKVVVLDEVMTEMVHKTVVQKEDHLSAAQEIMLTYLFIIHPMLCGWFSLKFSVTSWSNSPFSPSSPPPPPLKPRHVVSNYPRCSFADHTLEEGQKPLLIIYAGGTFGQDHNEKDDPRSPLVTQPGIVVFNRLMQDSYFTPRLYEYGQKRRLHTDEFAWLALLPNQLIDSTEAGYNEWNLLAILLTVHEDDYRGFVIIHGTDSLAYTAAALSFMLFAQSKPVVVTGSQRPLFHYPTDALSNLIGALELLKETTSPKTKSKRVLRETVVYFDSKVLIGNRVTKAHSSAFNAFHAPNMGVLGYFDGFGIHLDMEEVERLNLDRAKEDHFCQKATNAMIGRNVKWTKYHERCDVGENDECAICTELEGHFPRLFLDKNTQDTIGHCRPVFLQRAHAKANVAIVRCFPDVARVLGFSAFVPNKTEMDMDRIGLREAVHRQWGHTDVFGIVVEAYGAGNAPFALRMALKCAREAFNIPVVYLTGCHRGTSASGYNTAISRDEGVNLHDMVTESAYARMVITISAWIWEKKHFHTNKTFRDSVERWMAFPYRRCFTHTGDDNSKSKAIKLHH